MSSNREAVVVGAGLAGMTAALNLARNGREVLVIEKYGHVCGDPGAHPAVDITPMEHEKLGGFVGVDLGVPCVQPCDRLNVYAYGYRVPMDLTLMELYCVERGNGGNALDSRLYDLCVEAGVTFEFNRALVTRSDFASLPPDSIIATGLYMEPFEALHVPCVRVYGYLGRGRIDRRASAAVWFHDYRLDYAYYSCANGISFCLYFGREPIVESEWETFKDEQLAGQEGVECTAWDYWEGLVPVANRDNPQLFAGDKILAGTLSGMIEPFGLFGLHGSLVSGKIAAMALEDKAAAYAMFKRYTRFFKQNFLAKRLFDASPLVLKKRFLGSSLTFFNEHPGICKLALGMGFAALPGYRDLPA